MNLLPPFNLKKWIDEHREQLKPPVGNIQVFKENDDFIVMIVAGPNARKDFHYNKGEEFFYQLEGDITVRIMEAGKPRDILIKEGDVFLLPPEVPHSPQRKAGTIGIVIERYRREGEMDGFQWYCENCCNMLYEEYFPLENIVTQLPKVMRNFYDSSEHRTCNKC